MKAAAKGERFGGSFELDLTSKRAFGSMLRQDVVGELSRLGYSEQQLVGALADDFDAGNWPCLGYGDYVLRTGCWATDDFHDFTWPREYFHDINYVMADTRCDTKVPWEKSRMQWLSSAALACCVDSDSSNNAKRIQKAIALFDDWVSENPYGVGVNWVSSMEVAIRAVNLLLAFSLLEDQLSDTTAKRMMRSAGEHLHYLLRFPEASDVQGNHYLATALGVYLLEEFGGTPSEAPARAFVAACEEQFSSEGLHIEFSPTYHRLSMDMVVIGFSLMNRLHPTIAAELEPLVKLGLKACCTLANHGGELPVFSDNDSGMVLNFQQSARRFGAYGWLPLSGNQGEATLCVPATIPESIFGAVLAGFSGCSPEMETNGTPASAAIASLPPFAVLDNGLSKVVVRAGALGLGGRASHDHDDALSFWYSVGGEDLIVEAGCPPYTRDKQERGYAIASTSHNLLTAPAQERFAGAAGSVTLTLRGGHEGRVTVLENEGRPELHAELVAGTAVPATANPTKHERSFRYLADGELCVRDQATIAGAATFQLRFHLTPCIRVEDLRVVEQEVTIVRGDCHHVFTWSGSPIEGITVEQYSFHRDYGSEEPALCLVVSGPAATEISVTTTIASRGACEVKEC